jgi:hypothetical protein
VDRGDSWTSDGRIVVQCSDGVRRKISSMVELRSLSAPATTVDGPVAGASAGSAGAPKVPGAGVPPAQPRRPKNPSRTSASEAARRGAHI